MGIGVKLVKTHLKRTIKDTKLTNEELQTILCQIEACINSRPITPLTTNPNDHLLLTPGHFLTGRNILTITDTYPMDKNPPLKRWQHLQYITNQFWTQWSKHYLLNIQQRYKWNQPHQNIKINDIVLIQDERYPTTRWPLGKITKLHVGNDGIARVAEIHTQHNNITRPIHKLHILPIPQPKTNNTHQQSSSIKDMNTLLSHIHR